MTDKIIHRINLITSISLVCGLFVARRLGASKQVNVSNVIEQGQSHYYRIHKFALSASLIWACFHVSTIQ
jgi:hypothetical protein